MYTPKYIRLYEEMQLDERIRLAYERMKECDLCPRRCRINRLEGERGFCRSGNEPVVASFTSHFGEEAELVGRRGSGTIFLTNCNLRCSFCQNYDISHLGCGDVTSTEELGRMMLYLQNIGCHNINLVTPTHFVPQILAAIKEAAANGLALPLVYNCGGYESLETLRLLDGVIDIYMPDAKFWESSISKRFCNAPDYPEVMKEALREMHRQVGDLAITDEGLAISGMLIRHLVLPEALAGTSGLMHFIAQELSKDTYVNIMAQYRPLYKAVNDPLINRPISEEEYEEAIEIARAEGLHRGF